MGAAEQFILTVSENGYGKRSSSFEYRVTGRGGKGIVAMAVNDRKRAAGRLLPGGGGRPDHAGHRRRPGDPHAASHGIRIAGRGTQGVIVFDIGEGEKVVSVERLSEEEGE